MEPYEVSNDDVEAHIKAHGECVHLVPNRVWRDYQETSKRKAIIRDELKTYNRATFVVQAAKKGDPMPERPKT